MKSALIIGAGAAGLAAARDLSAAGLRVVVLEARDRIGGRVFTVHDESPIPVELGAEFVHGKHPAIMRELDKSEIPVSDVTGRHWFCERGEIHNSHEFWNKLTALMDLMSLDRPDQSFKDFLATVPDDPEARRAKAAASLYVEGFHAARVERIGVHGLVKANEAEDGIEGHHSFRIPGGYDQIMNALHDEASAHGAVFHLNTVVNEIHWGGEAQSSNDVDQGSEDRLGTPRAQGSEDRPGTPRAHGSEGQPGTPQGWEGRLAPTSTEQHSTKSLNVPLNSERKVEVSCSRGARLQTFTAECCLITLPLGVLQTNPNDSSGVRFVPELPQEKRNAIRGVEMGHVIRIVLHFRERWWEGIELPGLAESEDTSQLGFIHCPEAALPTWWTLLPVHAPVLVGWTGGSNAERMASMKPDEMLSTALSSVAQIFGIKEQQLRELLISSHTHDWNSDPFSRGAYAYLPLNGLKAQQQLAAPIHDILFFAGEATSVGHIGTVHGAIESGQRAAKEILNTF